jgi:predicted RNase H-like HicB family nuclease
MLKTYLIEYKESKMMDSKDYLKLPYNLVFRQITDESGSYFYARVLEFDGCQSTGDNINDAYGGLLEAMEGWIETKLENGYNIPEPYSLTSIVSA